MIRAVVALLSVIFLGAAPQIASAADARKGETLAKRWCASCHVVSADQKRGNTQANTFSTIASKTGFDETKLAYFLLAPHPIMPDMSLSRSEAADLAAYIKTQK